MLWTPTDMYVNLLPSSGVVQRANSGKYSSILDFPAKTFSASRSCLFRKRITEMVRSHLWRETKSRFMPDFLDFHLGPKTCYRSVAAESTLFYKTTKEDDPSPNYRCQSTVSKMWQPGPAFQGIVARDQDGGTFKFYI